MNNNCNILISIIVPVYNVEKYVHKCITSICNQTYDDLEIIVIDDGSTDNSPNICDELAIQDKRIIVVHQKHSGLSSARNVGIEIATGDIFAFVDGDDYIHPDMIRILYRAMKEHNADIGMCGRYVVDTKGNIITRMFTLEQETIYSNKDGIDHLLRFNLCDMAVWDKMFRADLNEHIHTTISMK